MLAVSIPTTGSPRSIFCLVGIIYFIVCAIICFRGIKGWLTVFSLTLIGMMAVSYLTPNPFGGEFSTIGIPGMTEQFKYRDKYVGVNEFVRNTNHPDLIRSLYEDMTYKSIYAMHNPDYSNYISPWVFHPGCLWWSPLAVFLLGIFGYATGAGKRG
jgi:hypothetical protein